MLADSSNFSRFLGVPERAVPTGCDQLADPKAKIIELARKSRTKAVRDAIVPKRGSTAKQGPDYNGLLGLFVRNEWDLEAATAGSPSLARTVNRLLAFKPVWNMR